MTRRSTTIRRCSKSTKFSLVCGAYMGGATLGSSRIVVKAAESDEANGRMLARMHLVSTVKLTTPGARSSRSVGRTLKMQISRSWVVTMYDESESKAYHDEVSSPGREFFVTGVDPSAGGAGLGGLQSFPRGAKPCAAMSESAPERIMAARAPAQMMASLVAHHDCKLLVPPEVPAFEKAFSSSRVIGVFEMNDAFRRQTSPPWLKIRGSTRVDEKNTSKRRSSAIAPSSAGLPGARITNTLPNSMESRNACRSATMYRFVSIKTVSSGI